MCSDLSFNALTHIASHIFTGTPFLAYLCACSIVSQLALMLQCRLINSNSIASLSASAFEGLGHLSTLCGHMYVCM